MLETKAETMAPKTKRMYLHCLIAVIIGIVLALTLRPGNGLTQMGISVIAVTIPTLYLWLTVNTHWTSILFLALIIITGVMTPNEVWAGSVGHFAVITMIIFTVLNQCLRETGVIDKIATWFITRKFVQGRPYAFLAMFFASHAIIGMFMENLSLAIIYIGLAGVLCDKLGLKKGDPLYTCLFMGTLWCNVVSAIATPIAHTLPNIIIGLAETQLGITITYGQYLAVGVPFTAIMYVVVMLCTRLWRVDTSAFKNFDLEEMKRNSPPLDLRGKVAAIAFILVLLAILLPELLKGFFPTACSFLSGLGVVVPAILALTALCLIPVKGKPILDMPHAMKAVPLPVVLFSGIVCVMSTPISSEATGINIWLGNILRPVIENFSPIAIILALVIGAIVMTNFMSNTVTMVLFFNLGVVLLNAGEMNMGAFTILIALAASMATLTPSANPVSPLFFGDEHLSLRSTVKINLLFIVLAFVVLMLFVWPFAQAIS